MPKTQLALPGDATDVSLSLPQQLSYDQWEKVGRELQRAERAVMWWIGDWLAYGEKRYGETYTQAVELTGRSEEKLQQAKWVSTNIENLRRRKLLSWSHHYEVASLEPDEQDALLSEAEKRGLSRNDLRKLVRGYKENHQYITSSESVEWYTPAKYIEAAREVMGGIDLDPASSKQANETVKAKKYFTKEKDGLSQNWKGRLWLNPPYRKEGGPFVEKLIQGYVCGDVESAILLVNANSNDASWFWPLWDYTLCFTYGRINFYTIDKKENGPTHGSCLVYFGEDIPKFKEVFEEFGAVVRRA